MVRRSKRLPQLSVCDREAFISSLKAAYEACVNVCRSVRIGSSEYVAASLVVAAIAQAEKQIAPQGGLIIQWQNACWPSHSTAKETAEAHQNLLKKRAKEGGADTQEP